MGPAIGNLLTLALGIAISPIPVVAGIQALLSPYPRATSLSFLAGWLTGTVITLIVFTLLSSILPLRDPDQNRPIAGVIKIVIGTVILLLAIRQIRSRAGEGEPRKPPWTSLTPLIGLRIGFVRSALHPTNLLFCLAAGTVLGAAALPVAKTVVAAAVFTVIASFTVWLPTFGHLVAPQATARPLGAMRDWSLRNNAEARSLVLLILGVFLVGNGVGNF